jgi:aryl-alcohol dehydrogenase-like predicted oxidoreductase
VLPLTSLPRLLLRLVQAEIYADGRSELFFGNALQKLLPQSRFTREELFISTKINPARSPKPEGGMGGIQRGLSRKAIFAAVEGSLQRLQTPYIDLYFIHRYDPHTSPEETMRALHDLVTAGRVRYIGASSMFLWQLVRLQNAAIQHGWTRFSAVQNLINLIYREDDREMNPYCRDNGIALMPYSPLAAGVLGRKTPEDAGSSRAQTDNIQRSLFYKASDDAVTAALRSVAEKRGLPPAQVALAWVLQRPGVASPIIGATKQHHIQDAVEALRIQLTEDELRQLEELYQPHAIAGHN